MKIDPSGASMGGAAIKLNAGGSAGAGRGQTVHVPEIPGLVETNGGDAEPRPIVAHRLKQAKMNRAAVVEQCQEQPDGSCLSSDCPYGNAQTA